MELFTYNQGTFLPSDIFTPSILQEAAPTLTVDISDTNVCLNGKTQLSDLAHELMLHVNRTYGTMFNDFTPPMATHIENGCTKVFSVQLHKNTHKV